MNFIEAANKFYEGDCDFITRKGWNRSSSSDADDAFFWVLGLDNDYNIKLFMRDASGRRTGDTEPLTKEDYNANDWAVFDFDRWKIREA